MATVYQHINKQNGKRYIGITTLPIQKRWGKNGYGYKTQYFYKAIKKYGWDMFEHIVIKDNIPIECANTYEIVLIAKYKTNNSKFGYNQDSGGKGSHNHIVTEESKTIMSQAKLGKRLSPDTEFKKGDIPWNKGKTGYKLNCKSKKNIPNLKMRERSKKILQLDLNGNVIKEYNGQYEVNDKWRSNVNACLNNRKKTAYGYKWIFKDRYEAS